MDPDERSHRSEATKLWRSENARATPGWTAGIIVGSVDIIVWRFHVIRLVPDNGTNFDVSKISEISYFSFFS